MRHVIIAVALALALACCDDSGGNVDWEDDEECDDGIPCTEDKIDTSFTPADGGPTQYNCRHTPLDERCDDGDVCTRVGCEPGE